MLKFLRFLTFIFISTSIFSVEIKKELTYNKYSLADKYQYKDKKREFQWVKISKLLDGLEIFQKKYSKFGYLANYKNSSGMPPLTQTYIKDIYSEEQYDGTTKEYKIVTDMYGAMQHQGIPLYSENNLLLPERYGNDGNFIAIIDDDKKIEGYIKVKVFDFEGEWLVPKKYVKETKTGKLEKVIFVDRKNQNISTLEQDKNIWKIRSMNPVTTGVDAPPHKFMTSLGAFLVLAKEEEVPYLVDGTTDIGGYFHFALRFNGGVYLHGVPIDLPETKLKEYSKSLGTVPESHMCVRNATSHAKFMFNWAEPFQSIVFVIR